MSHNPYYDPEKLGLQLLSFDESGLSYEFNILAFWATGDGRVFTARDSGCSCPTPFEGYAGDTQNEVLSQLQRVPSIEHGEAELESWGKGDSGDRERLVNWLKNWLEEN